MKLLNVACAKGSVPLDECEEAFKHIGVCLDNSGNKFGIAISGVARNVAGFYAPLDQSLGDALVKGIDALYDAGFDGPLAPKF